LTDQDFATAWDNLVYHSFPIPFEEGDLRRAAAIATHYMGTAGNGGLNNFLTSSYDLDANEVLVSLEALGAKIAASQLRHVLEVIGEPLLPSTQEERWDKLMDLWKDELDVADYLTEEADQEIASVLRVHVREFADYYMNITANTSEYSGILGT